MKSILVYVSVLALSAWPAGAVQIDPDICRDAGGSASWSAASISGWCRKAVPAAEFDCLSRAWAHAWSTQDAKLLCAGTTLPAAPVECALRASQGSFTINEAARLCAGALSTAPADCAQAAFRRVWSAEVAVERCRASKQRR